MKFPSPITVKAIAEKISASKIIGDENFLVTGINEIHKVVPGDLTFSDIEKYHNAVLNSQASVAIFAEEVSDARGKIIIIHPKPFEAYNSLVIENRPFKPLTTSISDTAEIGEGTILEPNVVIGHNVKIGKNCHIQANVTIYGNTIIGDNTQIHSGTVIASDAFYYKRHGTHYEKWHSGGRVIIGNDVVLGACCTINIGVSGDTVIGDGSKFDSQIHLGHGAVVGKHCLIAAQVGVGGKTIIGDYSVIYGQVGIAQNLVLGERITVLAQSGVGTNLASGKTYFGSPAVEAREAFKAVAAMRRLPEAIRKIDTLSNSPKDKDNG